MGGLARILSESDHDISGSDVAMPAILARIIHSLVKSYLKLSKLLLKKEES